MNFLSVLLPVQEEKMIYAIRKEKIRHLLLVLLLLIGFTCPGISAADKQSIEDVLLKTIEEKGIKEAIAQYRRLKEKDFETYQFEERQLNSLGYKLLKKEKINEAVEIFKLNTEEYPKYANGYNSLGEAYMTKGDKQLAINYYKKSVELNPKNLDGSRIAYALEHYSKQEHQVPMRDGVKLFTQLYLPLDTSQKYPVLMRRTPYSAEPYGENIYKNHLGPTHLFAEAKYIIVYQDVRGRYMSEGKFVNMRPIIKNKKTNSDIDESTDTYDTIAWLLKHIPNHNGRVGIWGASYPGTYAAMAAIDAHPALVAVCPQAPCSDWFAGDDWHHHGAFFVMHAFRFLRGFGIPRTGLTKEYPPGMEYPTPDGYELFLKLGPLPNIDKKYFKGKILFWDKLMKHGTYDDFWKARNLLPHLEKIKPAVMVVGGWYDAENLYGALNVYKSIRKQSLDNSKAMLVMGPWRHMEWARGLGKHLGNIDFGSNTAKYYNKNIELPFFNYYLKQKGEPDLPRVFVFEVGSNQWKSYDQWPPPNVKTRKLFLNTGGKLTFAEPTEKKEKTYDEFISDPNKPVPFTYRICNTMRADYMVEDQRFAARRPDVLVFESDVLTNDITLAGPIMAELYVSTSGTGSDWVVKLIDVFPDDAPDFVNNDETVEMGGYQMMVRGDVMRGKFRNSYENPQPFTPGQVTKVAFALQDINHCFLKGHKIMVQVQCSWFPLVDRNPQVFVDIYNAKEEDFRKATQRLYHSKKYPSHLRISVL
jgi:putative CocE/NonD family hydrolase